MTTMISPGFVQCEVCGEFNGSTESANLMWTGGSSDSRRVSVTCLCRGIPCSRCKTHLIHRPGSNSYEPDTNSIGHWPYFAGMLPCEECRAAEQLAKAEATT